jgi:uncharacterized protein YkwD
MAGMAYQGILGPQRKWIYRIGISIFVCSAVQCPGHASYAIDRNAVLQEFNDLRENPYSYVGQLEKYRTYFRSKVVVPPRAPFVIATQEGARPVDEAIDFLRRQQRLNGLTVTSRLSAAARDLVVDQSRTGRTGHIGSDGSRPGDRVRRHGGDEYVSELIVYGPSDPQEAVRQLLVDDGVPDRGHRFAMFDPSVKFVGISCGNHPRYRTMCVFDLSKFPDGELK